MSDPKITRDSRKQGNCFAVYLGTLFVALFDKENQAENFILGYHDRACLASSSAQFEEWTIKTEFFQFHG